ncbi:MAG: hypothetical protein J2P20_07850 [Pseudonocardia sp.]|nr:hypothetical protein [Pseudonocardia sp.]
MTSVTDGLEHGMTLDQLSDCSMAGGVFRSFCGVRFSPAAMVAPPGVRCHRCDVLWRDQRHDERQRRAAQQPGGRVRRLRAKLAGRRA